MFEMFENFAEENNQAYSSDSSSSSSSSNDSSNDYYNSYSGESGKIFVVSVGGSHFVDKTPKATEFMKFAERINSLKREGFKFVLVVGGGKIARDYIAAAKTLGANNYSIDQIAIAVTRVNARLLIQCIDNAFPEPLTSIEKAKEIIHANQTPVFGGLTPGFTTDTVAALLAEYFNGVFINLSNVDGVFNLDPNKHKNANMFSEMTHDKLFRLINATDARQPGENIVLDSMTVNVLKRSGIKTLVLNANNLPNFEAAVRGQEFTGTTISRTQANSIAEA